MGSVSNSGLADRLKIAIASAGGLNAAARKAGIPTRSLSNYASGAREPKASVLVAISRASGKSIGWLATGEGPCEATAAGTAARVDATPVAPEHIADEAELRDLFVYVEDYLRYNKRTMPPEKKAELAIELYKFEMDCRHNKGRGAPHTELQRLVAEKFGERPVKPTGL